MNEIWTMGEWTVWAESLAPICLCGHVMQVHTDLVVGRSHKCIPECLCLHYKPNIGLTAKEREI